MLRNKKKEIAMEGEILDRLYIKMSNNTQDDSGFFHIYYRRTHSILTNYLNIGSNIHERVTIIKELLSMCVEDFYTMLLENNIVINNVVSCMPNSASFVQKEEWFEGAWDYQTTKFCKDNSLIMVKEGLPVQFINDLMNKRAEKRRFNENILEISSRITGNFYKKPNRTLKIRKRSVMESNLLVKEYSEPSDIL